MARTVTGVDIGTRANKFLRGSYKGNTFHVSAFSYVEHAPAELAGAWNLGEPTFKPEDARVGVTGRDVNLRYTRVPQVPDWQLKKLMRFEVEEIGGQSGAEVASDFNVLPAQAENEGEDVALDLKAINGVAPAFTMAVWLSSPLYPLSALTSRMWKFAAVAPTSSGSSGESAASLSRISTAVTTLVFTPHMM